MQIPSHPIQKLNNAPAWYYSPEPDERDGLISRNIFIGRQRSNIRLDAYTWDALRELCDRENIRPHMLYQKVAGNMPKGLSFTVALRRHVLQYFRNRVKARRRSR